MQVSVIMPVYNAAPFLAQTLSSILSQTYEDFELIAIDDGSSDESSEILAEFAQRDTRIVFSRRENRGAGATAHECMEKSRNELVLRHDADDIMLPNRLERQIWFMQENPDISAATSYAWLVDRNGALLAEAKPEIDVARGIRESNPNWFVSLIGPATILRKRDILAVGGYPKYRFAEDRGLWGRLVVSGYRLAVQPEFLIKQRIHGASLCGSPDRHKHETCEWIDENIMRMLRGEQCLSFDEFQENRRNSPLLTRLSRESRELGLIFYKEATRNFADRKWWRFVKNGMSAVLLNPTLGFRMLQKVTLRR